MRVVLQRVYRSCVRVGGEEVARIGEGLNILLAVGKGDTRSSADWLSQKIAHLRIFPDERGRFHRSLLDWGGEALVVSQFTLYGDCRRGRRPSFDRAALPQEGRELYEYFLERLRGEGVRVKSGVFGAEMEVEIVNWGPVTLILERE